MTLQERVDYLSYIFDLLQDTNSRIEKEQIENISSVILISDILFCITLQFAK